MSPDALPEIGSRLVLTGEHVWDGNLVSSRAQEQGHGALDRLSMARHAVAHDNKSSTPREDATQRASRQ
jgi:hypothetical protein